MSIDEITAMIINSAPRLRTGEINQMTHTISELMYGDGSIANVQHRCNQYIGRGHMDMAQSNRLLDQIERALAL